jgi:hypothetical protein
LERLARYKSPDRQRWSAPSSYRSEWAARDAVAAHHICDDARVLEIGTGKGVFRQLVAGRCRYTGADLQPLDEKTLVLDIENDSIPPGPWDVIVLLGVLEYLYDPLSALAKIGAAAQKVVFSYCLPTGPNLQLRRRARGWVNALSEENLASAMSVIGLSLKTREHLDAADDFEQLLLVFTR